MHLLFSPVKPHQAAQSNGGWLAASYYNTRDKCNETITERLRTQALQHFLHRLMGRSVANHPYRRLFTIRVIESHEPLKSRRKGPGWSGHTADSASVTW